MALSTAPVWDRGHLHSRSLVLRTYVLNTGDGWMAMPGGLVRVAGADGPVVSMQKGGHSKDAWVLWDGPSIPSACCGPRDQPVELRRGSSDLPSRAADNLFWLGRYAERAECIARLLRCMMSRVRRAGGAGTLVPVPPARLLRFARTALCPKTERPAPHDLEDELISLMSDAQTPR